MLTPCSAASVASARWTEAGTRTMKRPLNFFSASACGISSPEAFMSVTTSVTTADRSYFGLAGHKKRTIAGSSFSVLPVATSKPLICQTTELTVGNVHRDFKTKTQISSSRCSPVHVHLHQGLALHFFRKILQQLPTTIPGFVRYRFWGRINRAYGFSWK